ncbi:hypothetical protein BABINDRAFT_7311 [Babjeviella inositovora NRRL Y-12698]|uniref:Uncharacterized protein n=1 Tax=Babjeviella inositovora NRRL Y-12698 TaxID=984486 RepID=A0A1E3QUI3_9ASCO|nr:uncharacterized protein BABINDRAFT_7311 [Babjeviella inositovora NRRL Y-12698]ODQ80597.1 hypothetical protein BABINDRAFT_7311 [Babjeviella inositovora NRRL Y-12698]
MYHRYRSVIDDHAIPPLRPATKLNRSTLFNNNDDQMSTLTKIKLQNTQSRKHLKDLFQDKENNDNTEIDILKGVFTPSPKKNKQSEEDTFKFRARAGEKTTKDARSPVRNLGNDDKLEGINERLKNSLKDFPKLKKDHEERDQHKDPRRFDHLQKFKTNIDEIRKAQFDLPSEIQLKRDAILRQKEEEEYIMLEKERLETQRRELEMKELANLQKINKLEEKSKAKEAYLLEKLKKQKDELVQLYHQDLEVEKLKREIESLKLLKDKDSNRMKRDFEREKAKLEIELNEMKTRKNRLPVSLTLSPSPQQPTPDNSDLTVMEFTEAILPNSRGRDLHQQIESSANGNGSIWIDQQENLHSWIDGSRVNLFNTHKLPPSPLIPNTVTAPTMANPSRERQKKTPEDRKDTRPRNVQPLTPQRQAQSHSTIDDDLLTGKLNVLTQRNAKLKTDLEQYKQQAAELAEENSRYERANESLRQSLTELEFKASVYEQESENLAVHNDDLRFMCNFLGDYYQKHQEDPVGSHTVAKSPAMPTESPMFGDFDDSLSSEDERGVETVSFDSNVDPDRDTYRLINFDPWSFGVQESSKMPAAISKDKPLIPKAPASRTKHVDASVSHKRAEKSALHNLTPRQRFKVLGLAVLAQVKMRRRFEETKSLGREIKRIINDNGYVL